MMLFNPESEPCDLLRRLAEKANEGDVLAREAYNEIVHIRGINRKCIPTIAYLHEVASGDSESDDLLMRRCETFLGHLQSDEVLAGEFEFFGDQALSGDLFEIEEDERERAFDRIAEAARASA